MKKNIKRINEKQLRAIVAESVKNVLNEKYNPWQRVETEYGGIQHPRYDKDTSPYREKIKKQSTHLYQQIKFFLETLKHAYPNFPDAKDNNDFNQVIYDYQELEDSLQQALIELDSFYIKVGMC